MYKTKEYDRGYIRFFQSSQCSCKKPKKVTYVCSPQLNKNNIARGGDSDNESTGNSVNC
jgi:hypothetical protein